MKLIKRISVLLIFIIVTLCIIVGEYFYKTTQGITTRHPNTTLEAQIKNNSIDTAWFNTVKYEKTKIDSDFGYQLDGILISNKDTTLNTIIICHGVGAHKYAMFRFAKMYYELGFNIFLFDTRAHGESGGEKYSFGYYEKYDLEKVVSFTKTKYNNGIIGIHGESMGAAGCLLHTELNCASKNVNFYIEDCGYADLKAQFAHRLKEEFGLKNFGLIELASLASKLHDGYFFANVSPIKALTNVKVPIMFIHGMNDNYVPTYMGKQMHEFKKGKKEIYLVPQAKHAGAFNANPDIYKNKVKNFLVKNGFISE